MLILRSAPTAGGQYHWASEFAPAGKQKILSYIAGMALIVSIDSDSSVC